MGLGPIIRPNLAQSAERSIWTRHGPKNEIVRCQEQRGGMPHKDRYMREKCPSNCQNSAECCKTSNLNSSARLVKTAHAAAARGCCCPRRSGDDGEAAEVARHDGRRQWDEWAEGIERPNFLSLKMSVHNPVYLLDGERQKLPPPT